MNKKIATALVVLLTGSTLTWAGEDALLNAKGKEFAKSGNIDFAFMQYHALLANYPQSKFKEQAVFALGEYNYALGNYKETERLFKDHLTAFPNSAGKFFALAYLFKIAELNTDDQGLENYKKEIVNFKQVSLVFRKSKEYAFISPLNHKYRAVVGIDTIEFYVNEELFAKISY